MKEGLSEVVWHVTSIPRAHFILKDGELKGLKLSQFKGGVNSSPLVLIQDMINKYNIPREKLRTLTSVSFARSLTTGYIDYLAANSDVSSSWGPNLIVAFKMDGRRLKNLGKAYPVHEWYEVNDRIVDEMEDRLLLAPNRHIKPIERYCLSVHTLLPPLYGEGAFRMSHLERLEEQAKQRGIPFYYHSSYPFVRGNVVSKEDRAAG